MKYKKLLIVLTAVTALGIAGCGKSSKETAEVTPTPVPTAAPTAAPAKSTPPSTSTRHFTGYIHTASYIYTCTEADRCKDQYCKICLSYQQHEGRDP